MAGKRSLGIRRGIGLLVVGLLGALAMGLMNLPLECASPRFMGWHRSADEVLGSFVRETGGLPKQSIELDTSPSRNLVEPIAHWTVEQTRVGNSRPFLLSLLDDDPTYWIESDVRILYEDDSEALMQWRAWSYGLVACPVVWSGDGPPGRIELVELVEQGR